VVVVGALLNAVVGVLSLFAPQLFLSSVGLAGAEVTAAARLFADYTAARDLAIAGVLLGLLARRSTGGLPSVLVLVGAANVIDALVGVASQRWAQVPGSLVFAAAYLATAAWLARQGAPR
jgi:hypothetical protein